MFLGSYRDYICFRDGACLGGDDRIKGMLISPGLWSRGLKDARNIKRRIQSII